MIPVLFRLAVVTTAAILIATITDAEAAPVDFRATWDAPTTCTDGSALPLTNIAAYELEAVDLNTLKRTVKFPKVGTTGYKMTLEGGKYGFRIRANKTDGLKGVWSQQVVLEKWTNDTTVPLPICPSTCRCEVQG